ncbi:DUF397 domain-containing protein [Streptomyces sp. NPDC006703]|uniref:DUF397 domain-containing protein n=1 Tax=Streptomyces sp. NPDC006703 TaxID=3364759 RepID=UPI0036737245
MNTHKRPSTASALAPEWAWRKSSYSSGDTGNCIEIAELANQVGIRDSKIKNGPALVVPTRVWSSFVDMVK